MSFESVGDGRDVLGVGRGNEKWEMGNGGSGGWQAVPGDIYGAIMSVALEVRNERGRTLQVVLPQLSHLTAKQWLIGPVDGAIIAFVRC